MHTRGRKFISLCETQPSNNPAGIHNNTHAFNPHVLQQAAICLWKIV